MGIVASPNLGLNQADTDTETLPSIHIQTPDGVTEITYDPNVIEVDPDIGVVCMALQNLRNMGQLADATITLHLPGGPSAEFSLNEVELVE